MSNRIHFTAHNACVEVSTNETAEHMADAVAEFLDDYTTTDESIAVRFCNWFAGHDTALAHVVPVGGRGGVFVDGEGGVFADVRGMWRSPDEVPPAFTSTAMSTVSLLVYVDAAGPSPQLGRYLGPDLGWRLHGSPSTWPALAWQPVPLAPVRRR